VKPVFRQVEDRVRIKVQVLTRGKYTEQPGLGISRVLRRSMWDHISSSLLPMLHSIGDQLNSEIRS